MTERVTKKQEITVDDDATTSYPGAWAGCVFIQKVRMTGNYTLCIPIPTRAKRALGLKVGDAVRVCVRLANPKESSTMKVDVGLAVKMLMDG